MKEYEKIETIFARDDKTKKLNENIFRNETVEFLKDLDWEFTEKIDGTNIRIVWDGHKVSYYGRTDKAQIPSQLMNRLIELFGGNTNEEMFEQKFGDMPVMLIGEGYGAKIQKGGDYRPDNDFILFDVCINDNYLSRENVKDIANYFNIDVVPTIMVGKLQKVIDCDWNKRNGNGHSTCHLCKTLTWDSFCYDFKLKILDKELFNTVLCGDCISKIQNELKCRMVSNEEIIEEVEEDEFKDIEEIPEHILISVNRMTNNIAPQVLYNCNKINELIKNQKKIIERLNK